MRSPKPAPEKPPLRSRVGPDLMPVMVGASGRTYLAQVTAGQGRGFQGVRTYDATVVFSGMEEAPVKLVWNKETRLPPLRWLPETEARPAPRSP